MAVAASLALRLKPGSESVQASAPASAAPSVQKSAQVVQMPLPGKAIPKFVEPLPYFAGLRVKNTNVTVEMSEFQQKILPAAMYVPDPLNPPAAGVDPKQGTYVWGYKVDGNGPL
jgi:hypothetical protein